MSEETEALTLDGHLHAVASDCLEESGDVITGWLAILGVRRCDGDGYVITLRSSDLPPIWQLRGLLCETIAELDRGQLRAELIEPPTD